MKIRTLPRRRPSKNKRKNGRWVRSAILGQSWVPPNVRIELWLLDGERREVQRARDRAGQVVEFHATSWLPKLVEAVQAIGEGYYRLTGRGPDGRIVARRDFEAMWPWRSESEVPQYKPRNEVERVTGELRAAEAATRAAEAAREAAEARAVALEASLAAVVAERDAQVEALERALTEQQDQLDRVRRLYRRLTAGSGAAAGSIDVDGTGRGAGDDPNDSTFQPERSQPRHYLRPRGSGATTEEGRDEKRTSAGQGTADSANRSGGKQASLIDEALIASFERTIDIAARFADRFKGTTSEASKAPNPAAPSPDEGCGRSDAGRPQAPTATGA